MPSINTRSWKMERASVHREGKARARSNKYSHSDSHPKPAPGTRQRVWVGGTRKTTAPPLPVIIERRRGPEIEGHQSRCTRSSEVYRRRQPGRFITV